MKNIFLFCIATFFLFSCTGKKAKTVDNDLTANKIKGNVKTIDESDYTAHDSSGQVIKGDWMLSRHVVFDQKGNKIEEKIHNNGDSITTIHICIYDSNEHLVKDSGDAFMGTNWDIYLYDTKGNRIERDQYYLDNGKARRGITEYYKVDEKGNKIEEDSYWGNKDSLNYKAYIKYNDRGQEIENANFDSKGKPFVKVIRLYDEKGNQIEYQYYNRDTLENRRIFKYDSAGNQTEGAIYTKDGSLSSKSLCKYDNKGNMTEETLINPDGSVEAIISVQVESYDKEGNWLKNITFNSTIGGKPTNIVERTITYY